MHLPGHQTAWTNKETNKGNTETLRHTHSILVQLNHIQNNCLFPHLRKKKKPASPKHFCSYKVLGFLHCCCLTQLTAVWILLAIRGRSLFFHFCFSNGGALFLSAERGHSSQHYRLFPFINVVFTPTPLRL